MAKTYYLTSTDSDLSGGGTPEFDKALQTSAPGNQSIALDVGSVTTERGYGFTPSGDPGADGATGDYTIEVNVDVANSDIQCSIQLHRVNSSGTVQTSGTTSSEQSLGSTGVKTFNFTSESLGTWASGDRLRVDYIFRTTGHGSKTATIGAGTTDEEVVTPFSAGTTHQLTATAAAVVTTAAPGPHRTRPLAATAAAASSTTAPGPHRTRPLSGTAAAAVNTVAAGVQRIKSLSGTSAATSSTAAALNAKFALSTTAAVRVFSLVYGTPSWRSNIAPVDSDADNTVNRATVSVPTHADGDLLLTFVVGNINNIGDVKAPPGWVLAWQGGSSPILDEYHEIWWRIATDSEPASYEWQQIHDPAANYQFHVLAVCYNGPTDVRGPIGQIGAAWAASGATMPAPSITPDNSDSVLLTLAKVLITGFGSPFTPDASTTERVDSDRWFLGDETLTSGAATGSRSTIRSSSLGSFHTYNAELKSSPDVGLLSRTRGLTSTAAAVTTTAAPGPHRTRPLSATAAAAVTTTAALTKIGSVVLSGTSAATTTTTAPGPHRIRPLTSTCAVTTTTEAPGPHRIRPLTSTAAVVVTTVAALTKIAGASNQIEGITYDNEGSALGSVECYLFKDNLDDTLTFVDQVVSNASTGAYSFTDIADTDAQYLVYAIKEDSPHVMDVTDHVCQPAASPSVSYDLYLRSDTDKGETSPDNDLRLRSDEDKAGATQQLTATAAVVTTTEAPGPHRVRPIAATAAAATTTTAALQRSQALTATAAAAVTTTAALNARFALSGTAAAAVTTTAALTKIGSVVLSGTAAAATSTAAALNARFGLTATAAAVVATTAPGPHRIRPFAGTAAAAATTTATILRAQGLTATAAAVTTTTAALVAIQQLTATASVSTVTTAALLRSRPLSSTAVAASSTTAAVNAKFALSSTAAAAVTTTAALTKTGSIDLSGTAAAATTTTASLNATFALTATAGGSSTSTGAIQRTRPLASTAGAVSVTTAALGRAQPISGTSATTTSTLAALNAKFALSGTSAAAVTTTAALSKTGSVDLSGTAAATTTTLSTLNAQFGLSSTAAAAVTTTAALTRIGSVTLSGTASAAVTTTAPGPHRVRPASGTAAATTTTTGALVRIAGLSGTSAATVSTTAALAAQYALSGTATAVVTTTAVLTEISVHTVAADCRLLTVGPRVRVSTPDPPSRVSTVPRRNRITEVRCPREI